MKIIILNEQSCQHLSRNIVESRICKSGTLPETNKINRLSTANYKQRKVVFMTSCNVSAFGGNIIKAEVNARSILKNHIISS
jgi:hypothetical protein